MMTNRELKLSGYLIESQEEYDEICRWHHKPTHKRLEYDAVIKVDDNEDREDHKA